MNTDKQPQTVYAKSYVRTHHALRDIKTDENICFLSKIESVYVLSPKQIEALIQSEREADQWISVKDKLPEIDMDDPWNKEFCQSKDVWTYSSFGMRQGRYIHRGEYSTWRVDGASSSNEINVTHWMPLPQPPKQ